MVRRRAADRRGHRLHLQPDHRRRPGGADLGLLPHLGHRGRGPGRHHRRAHAGEAQRGPPAAADPDRARARLVEHRREGGQDATPAEPTDGQPVVGSGPFRLVEGTAGGSTYRFERNPDYWQGAPHVDEVVFRVYKSRGPDGAGAGQGRDRLRRGHHRAPGAGARGRGGHHRPERRLPRLRRDRLQHRRRRHRDRRADRATGTRRSRTRPSATRSTSRSTASRSSRGPTRAPASPATRSSRRSTATTTGPRRRRTRHLRPRQGRRAAHRGRLRPRLRRPAPDARRQRLRHPAALRPQREHGLVDGDGLLRRVARRARHRVRDRR